MAGLPWWPWRSVASAHSVTSASGAVFEPVCGSGRMLSTAGGTSSASSAVSVYGSIRDPTTEFDEFVFCRDCGWG